MYTYTQGCSDTYGVFQQFVWTTDFCQVELSHWRGLDGPVVGMHMDEALEM